MEMKKIKKEDVVEDVVIKNKYQLKVGSTLSNAEQALTLKLPGLNPGQLYNNIKYCCLLLK